jgi:hypothetical protein
MKEVRYLVVLLFGIIMLSGLASSLGIRPAKVEMNFVPNNVQEIKYTVETGSPDDIILVSAQGELAEYVSFDKDRLKGGGNFVATLKMPASISKPGYKKLYISASEDTGSGGMIGSKLEIRGLIKIFVPFKGKYVDVVLEVPNANINEKINGNVKFTSQGTEDTNVVSSLRILDYSDKEIYKNSFDVFNLVSFGEKTIPFFIDSNGWKPGAYSAIVDVMYGEESKKVNTSFMIGSFFVNITNFTEKLPNKGIQRFYVFIESKWNGDLDNVYADVNISNSKESFVFRTPSVKLPAWKSARLEGYLDTAEMMGNYDSSITLSYGSGTTKASGKLKIYESGLLSSLSFLLSPWTIVIVLLAVLAIVIVVLIRSRKYSQNGKEIKKLK